MASKLDPVSQRYAEALFGLAKSKGVLENVQADVKRLALELERPGVGTFFVDERVSVEVRREKMGPLLQGMHELVRNFVHLVLDKRREPVLLSLGQAFQARMLAERGAAEGVVESARPLGAGEIGELAVLLGKRLGKQIALENRVVPELIGGVRVIVESKMIDASVSGRLEQLRRHMTEAALPSLQDA